MPIRPRAVLVAVHTPDRTAEDLHASLDELGRLCDTLGMEVVGRVTQRRQGTGGATLLGPGRLERLADWTGGPGKVTRGPPGKHTEAEGDDPPTSDDDGPRATAVVADHELTPSQLRNLQRATGADVYDRTGVILEIFHRHARSREARLQVEAARLAYMAPRLREAAGPTQRQGGGVGAKGAGETALELDRRRVRDRLAQIRRELAAIEIERGARRARREAQRQVALVGYTNAGKSSLVRMLTGADVLIANQLFATLDTTIRRLDPPATPPILVTDTVGFIRDLPHGLVASFRSTLDAAMDAALLLHVVDAADPAWREQADVTVHVLTEIGAGDLPRQLVFNQCDRLEADAEAALAAAYPDAWRTSAKQPERVSALRDQIAEWFAADHEQIELLVPWSHPAAIALAHSLTEVLDEQHELEGARLRLRGTPLALERVRKASAGR